MEDCEEACKTVHVKREETSSSTVSMAKRRRISSERENCFEMLRSVEFELKEEETSRSVSGEPTETASFVSGEAATVTKGVEEDEKEVEENDRRLVLSRVASCDSSNNILKSEISKAVDSEVKRSETVNETSTATINTNSREITNKKLRFQMEKKAPANGATRRMSPAEVRMPPESEIEEFFAAAEKYEQKRFADKYNYDIVKDEPLEGRYQWIRLK